MISVVSSDEPVSQTTNRSTAGKSESSVRSIMAASFLTIMFRHMLGTEVMFFFACEKGDPSGDVRVRTVLR